MGEKIDCGYISDCFWKETEKDLQKIINKRENRNLENKLYLTGISTKEDKGIKAYSNIINKKTDKLNKKLYNGKIIYKNIFTKNPLNEIKKENKNSDGIILFGPLSEETKKYKKTITESIDSKKDIEGITSKNLGFLFKYIKNDSQGRKYIVPSTAKAIIKTLNSDKNRIISENPNENFDKKLFTTILNDSYTIGRPLGEMLRNLNITSVECGLSTKKQDIERLVKNSDLLITALPKDFGYIKPGKIGKHKKAIIDVSFTGNLGTQEEYEKTKQKTDFITPYPGKEKGVGSITTAVLFQNFCYALKFSS